LQKNIANKSAPKNVFAKKLWWALAFGWVENSHVITCDIQKDR
jgi:hypothetical protein